MGRLARDSRLETREARSRLAQRAEPYWKQIHPGLFIGYYKGKTGGTWLARVHVPGTTQYRKVRLGKVDDFTDSDGETILSFRQAHAAAIAAAAPPKVEPERTPLEQATADGYTVNDAFTDYLKDYRTRGKDHAGAAQSYNKHIRDALGSTPLAKLTTEELRTWLTGLATVKAKTEDDEPAEGESADSQTTTTKSADPDAQRKAKATANRIWNILRAALNHAFLCEKVASDGAWRRVKPFAKVDVPQVAYLTPSEAKRLLNACEPDFRALVRGALLTGARYGELTRMEVGDFDPANVEVFVRHAKSGRPRHVPLSPEGVAFFERQTVGKRRGDRMFTRSDGAPWGRAHQHRRIKYACDAAGIEPAISFHVLRHTYGSALAQAGVPLKVIAEALGHADTRVTERHYGHLSDQYVAQQVWANLPSFGFEGDNVAALKPGLKPGA